MSDFLWAANKEKIKKSKLSEFCSFLESHNIQKFNENYQDLWEWSVKNSEKFWSLCWDFTKIIGDKGTEIINKNNIFYKNKFFPDSKLNFAENLLFKKDGNTAIFFRSESGLEKKINWQDLYINTCKLSAYYKKIGIKKSDRIAAYTPNNI